jgi:hypothetical protein
MNITAAARPAIAIVLDRLLVHHAARADLGRLDLSTRGCFFMRIDRLTGIRILLDVRSEPADYRASQVPVGGHRAAGCKQWRQLRLAAPPSSDLAAVRNETPISVIVLLMLPSENSPSGIGPILKGIIREELRC